ncbi:hypothetical protein LCGC14_1170730 [marine sediment metagenome]|uniref:Uncharacterized protein n=1 Tax=marine sediment metagenome TaxID=412755 RepID=A0A0F9LPW2_9ZZZZ
MKDKQDLQKRIEQADMDSVGKFMKIFDKMLLYTIAVNFLPQEAIHGTVDLWDKVIKKGINEDAISRTKFLESTQPGRMALYREEPDGEDIRLHFLEQWKLAREVILENLSKGASEEDDLEIG